MLKWDPEQVSNTIMRSRWYPVVNDLIGGWAVATVDKPLADVRIEPSSDEFWVLDTISEEIARHVSDLHNREMGV